LNFSLGKKEGKELEGEESRRKQHEKGKEQISGRRCKERHERERRECTMPRKEKYAP